MYKKTLCFIILTFSCVLLYANTGSYYEEEIGVHITWALRPNMFPQSWRTSKIDAQAKPLAKEEIARSLAVVKKALAKYPKSILYRNLYEVYIVSELTYYGISAGGTNSRDKVYIVNAGKNQGYSDEQIEKLFHAEFSSILMRNYHRRFPYRSWKENNPPTFLYGGSGVEAIREKKSSQVQEELYLSKGFLSEYATSTLENDFNAIAQHLFMGEKKFWNHVEKHPKLLSKIKLGVSFYQSIHSDFTEEFFRGLVPLDRK